jgi:uncharacterized zinc-type alcohol dehydrogenase-like protein
LIKTSAYATHAATSPLVPFSFERRDPLPEDVQIEILFCGVCHSDLHTARNEWPGTVYPFVPGHEIVGRIVKVGSKVHKFKEGDLAGVGVMVDSCRKCESCRAGLEQYCDVGLTGTYNSPDKHIGGMTCGGYSKTIVVDHNYAFRINDPKNLAGVAPLLCAGITTYSPLRYWKAGKGQKVGIVGLGGLGHMGVKFANAFGAHTVMLTTTAAKSADAKRLGAHEVIVTKDPAQLEKHANSFDLLLNTVSAHHDVNTYLNLLKRDGTIIMVGGVPEPLAVAGLNLLMRRRRYVGSIVGSVAETQEMLDFCAERGIAAEVEVIPIQKINEAYERMLRSDVKYRFVIDMSSLA